MPFELELIGYIILFLQSSLIRISSFCLSYFSLPFSKLYNITIFLVNVSAVTLYVAIVNGV